MGEEGEQLREAEATVCVPFWSPELSTQQTPHDTATAASYYNGRVVLPRNAFIFYFVLCAVRTPYYIHPPCSGGSDFVLLLV